MQVASQGLIARMQRELGVVIPAWFPAAMAPDEIRGYLRQTLDEVEHYCRPGNVFLVVDGCPHAEEAIRASAEEVGDRSGEACRVIVSEVNQGKGGSVAQGLEQLLEHAEVRYIVARDSDGDHDAHDLVRMFRRAVTTEQRERADNLFAVGSRTWPQMPLGWVRGEYELLLNRALVEAVNVRLATEDRRVDLRYSLPEARYPDFQSGYKLYTRRTARANIEAILRAHESAPEAETMRWGAEFVTVTELLLQGAIPVEVSRVSFDEQPQTTFDESDRVHAFGRQFVWLFRRLNTPSEIARPITDNAIAQSPARFAGGVWDELLKFREYVRSHAYPSEDWGDPPPHGELL